MCFYYKLKICITKQNITPINNIKKDYTIILQLKKLKTTTLWRSKEFK
ncbi:11552_t:CDS:2 [Entrophospora sp. SA101]|nr:11552_t:CDS:2 [Entrophospora sp. SA101]